MCSQLICIKFFRASTVRNIPKFKDRANWSGDTFQPMRRRVCVYQQTNQNIAPVLKNFQNNGRSRPLKMSLQYLSRSHIQSSKLVVTKCSAASWSALKACETSCAYSSLKKCCRATEWKRCEIYHFSRSVSSLHSLDTLQMGYQSLRNVAMHFKAFKCV